MEKNLKKLKSLKQDYNEVFSTESGKRVLEDLKRIGFYNTTTINEMTHIVGFNEGQRTVVLHILTRMNMETIKEDEQ